MPLDYYFLGEVCLAIVDNFISIVSIISIPVRSVMLKLKTVWTRWAARPTRKWAAVTVMD